MKYLIVLGLFALAQQQDPAHPFPNHEPPADYYCVMAMNDKAVQTDVHACACVGMVTSEKLCGETDEETYARVNSSLCKSYCRPSSCQCAVACRDSN